MRKCLMSLACLCITTSLVLAAEVTLVKYDADRKEITVKEGDSIKSYRLTDKSRVVVLKDGAVVDATLDTAIKLLSKDKAKGKLKFELTTEKDSIVELRLRPRRLK